MSQSKISLFLVPTPIGNLRDITLRAIDTLQAVDVILAEDTRTSGILLKHLQISKNLQSYHSFNEHKAVEKLVERMKKGETFALISDAGTPAISDPGFLLVRAVLAAGLPHLFPPWWRVDSPTIALCLKDFCPIRRGEKHGSMHF
jgi:16S rRNA (cytidine1402-2'-O)-methyltransferase